MRTTPPGGGHTERESLSSAEGRALVIEAIDQGRLISEQPPGRCGLCGAVAETRPYGPNGEEVCFDCGMKDVAAAKRGFDRRFS